MLRRRIIPCLDVSGGRVVKGVEFVNLRDCGEPVDAALRYADQGADVGTLGGLVPGYLKTDPSARWTFAVGHPPTITGAGACTGQ